LQFNNPASEMFEFTATVRGYAPDPAGASAQDGGSASGGSVSGGDSSGGSASGGNSLGGTLQQAAGVLRFTVNPLTRTVSVSLVR
jgi:hypothetical protein